MVKRAAVNVVISNQDSIKIANMCMILIQIDRRVRRSKKAAKGKAKVKSKLKPQDRTKITSICYYEEARKQRGPFYFIAYPVSLAKLEH